MNFLSYEAQKIQSCNLNEASERNDDVNFIPGVLDAMIPCSLGQRAILLHSGNNALLVTVNSTYESWQNRTTTYYSSVS